MTTADALAARLACDLYNAAMCGTRVPYLVDLYARMRTPRAGDLVVEITKGEAIGRLLRDEGRGAYVIEPLDQPGVEARWTNSQFVAVPPPDVSAELWSDRA